jgi:hypothetical protein
MMRNVHLKGPLGVADIDNGLRVEDNGFAD